MIVKEVTVWPITEVLETSDNEVVSCDTGHSEVTIRLGYVTKDEVAELLKQFKIIGGNA